MSASIDNRAPHSTADPTWVRTFHQSTEAEISLLCFPHAGGSASYFHPLSQALTPRIEVSAVQYPGRQDRRFEPAVDRIEELAEQVHRALGPGRPRGLAFFGHSMGATVAFEVVRRIERDGQEPPRLLFASGRRAPSLSADTGVHRGGDARILAEIRRLSSAEATLPTDPEMLAAALPALRGDYRAIETYRCAPGTAVGCPIEALVGNADPVTTVEQARAWREHTAAEFDLRVFAGGHFYLDGWPHEVLARIRERLAGGAG